MGVGKTITCQNLNNKLPNCVFLDGQQRLTCMYRTTCSTDAVLTKTDKGKEIKRFYYLDITRYTAVSSMNLRTQIAEYYVLAPDGGLSMNLGYRVFFVCENIFICYNKHDILLSC